MTVPAPPRPGDAGFEGFDAGSDESGRGFTFWHLLGGFCGGSEGSDATRTANDRNRLEWPSNVLLLHVIFLALKGSSSECAVAANLERADESEVEELPVRARPDVFAELRSWIFQLLAYFCHESAIEPHAPLRYTDTLLWFC